MLAEPIYFKSSTASKKSEQQSQYSTKYGSVFEKYLMSY